MGADGTLRRRRWLMGAASALAVLGGFGVAAAADGDLTVTPANGEPGDDYRVTVSCGESPMIYRRNLQDDRVQGTIAPFPADEVVEVSPSSWAVDQVATRFDAEYRATCADVEGGEGRFDAEAPHLWFGPRPRNVTGLNDPKTTVEGTDCPPGTTARVAITSDGETSVSEATIDQYGDWSLTLPAPLGTQELTIEASCGDVLYDSLRVATTMPTGGPATTAAAPSTPAPVVSGGAEPATARPGNAAYTG